MSDTLDNVRSGKRAAARVLMIAGALASGLAGCSKAPAEASQKPAAEVQGPASNSADPYTGVASTGETQAVVQASDRTSEAAPASQGDGRSKPSVASASEFNVLSNLPTLQSKFGVETIIDKDDRVQVTNTTSFPARAQVLVVLPGGRCSGTLVGKDLVLTAGHCVHSGGGSGAWMTSATVYPGRNGAQSPYGGCQAKRFYSVLGWTRDGNQNYDIGAIKLNCDIGANTGWMGVFWQSATLVGKSARVSGYPGDKPLEQWTHKDKVIAETATQTRYQTDTMPGNSGSGVIAEGDAPAGCNGPCVHSVHAYGSGGGNANSGTRITQPLFANIVQWIAAPK